jgi:hypothetical protein
MARPRRHGLELAPELRDLEAQALAVLRAGRPPHIREELPMRQHLAGVTDERVQELVLDGREVDLVLVDNARGCGIALVEMTGR